MVRTSGAKIAGSLHASIISRAKGAGDKIELTDGWVKFHDLKADAVLTVEPYEQTIFWLAAIRYAIEDLAISTASIARLTSAYWADMGVKGRLIDDDNLFCRHRDYNNYYCILVNPDLSTADHQIQKKVAGTVTTLATEAVDLTKEWRWYLFETVGNTLNSYRAPTPTDDVPTTPTITATDTDIADGRFGGKHYGHGSWGLTGLYIYFKAPASEPKQPLKYYVVPLDGEGTEENPYRPKLPVELVEVNKVLWIDEPRYTLLKKVLTNRGFTENEVRDLAAALGILHVKRYVNKLAATWSALIPTPRGQPVDSICLVRIFEIKTNPSPEKFLEKLRELGAQEITREEAIRLARKLDDRLHEADLLPVAKDDEEAKEKAKEYIEWRESQFKVKMDEKVAIRYVKERKGW